MLNTLAIRNVVLIEKLDLDFGDGLSVLTGETGAGKSILLDSLGLILGNRAETSLIRQGEDKLSVTAVFSSPQKPHAIYELADEYDIDINDEIAIKRTLSKDGKSKIFINDQPVSAKLLKEFGSCLVEIHGQFDNHGLLNPSNHKDILDSYGGYASLVDKVKNKFNEYKSAQSERAILEDELEKAKIDEDNLKHWVDELIKLKPMAGEETELLEKRAEIMNAEKILESMNFAYGNLTQKADILSAIRQSQSAVDKANRIVEGKYDGIVDALEQAFINADEAIRTIEEASSQLALNSNEIDSIEQRLYALRSAARKHNVVIDDLSVVLEDMKKRLDNIEHGEEGLTEAHAKERQLRLEYMSLAKELSAKRKSAADLLDKRVMSELPALKMEKANFVTKIEELPESLWNDKGIDGISFTVSTNPNSPQGPLNKIASGGELARFMLALKVNLAGSSSNVTMIFDEVDAGVGGATAKAVGDRLAKLAKDVQVLIVTHSPQVAACGNNHFKVEKKTENNITTTYVNKLDDKQQSEEIARMLAGEHITDEARAAANVLIKKDKN